MVARIIFVTPDFRNPNAKSIEDDVFKALCKAGAISKDNSDDPKKVE